MLEQEMASVIKFALDKAHNPSPYYWNVQNNFMVPAMYFPTPEIVTGGETFSTYRMKYLWNIVCFHKTSQKAYALALDVLTAIKRSRNLIPLITETGERATGGVRIDDPQLKMLDDGAAQLSLSWVSRRPYDEETSQKMQTYEVEGWNTPDIYLEKHIPAAFAAAMEKYAITLPTPPQEAGTIPKKEA